VDYLCVATARVSITITTVFYKIEFQTRRQRKVFSFAENCQIINACIGQYYVINYVESYCCCCLTTPGETHLEESISQKFLLPIRSPEI
jgi:hypothetical protein